MAAQPREMVVGNIVRRVLGLIRDEAEDDRDAEFALSETGSESQCQTPRAYDGQSKLFRYHASPSGKPHDSLTLNRSFTAFGSRYAWSQGRELRSIFASSFDLNV